jgi:deazaflavin-dependent oxidoreductase (nitroreductase family)
MDTDISQGEARLRQLFKHFNLFMLLVWRLGLGKWLNAWPSVGGRILVLTHTGRKSGLRRRTPLNYAVIEGDLYCTAGFGARADWYRNLLANPLVEVWTPRGCWSGVAEDVSDAPERLPYLRQVLIASGFAARLAGINPHTLTNEGLHRLTHYYRLVRIRPHQPLTGPGGPGDLVWVWPLVVLLLVIIYIRRRMQS